MDPFRIIYTAENEWALQSLVTNIDGQELVYVDCYPDMRFASREDAEKFICESDISFSGGEDKKSEAKAGCGEHLKPARTYELRFLFRAILDRIGAWCYRRTTPPHPDRVNLTEAELNIIHLGLCDALANYHKVLNTGTVSVPWEIVESWLDFVDWSCYYCRHPTGKGECNEDCCISNEARLLLVNALIGDEEVNQVK